MTGSSIFMVGCRSLSATNFLRLALPPNWQRAQLISQPLHTLSAGLAISGRTSGPRGDNMSRRRAGGERSSAVERVVNDLREAEAVFEEELAHDKAG